MIALWHSASWNWIIWGLYNATGLTVFQMWLRYRKKRGWKYIPTLSSGKYDRKSKWGEIPNFFTAKQAWLFSAARISKTLQKLNPKAKNFGRMDDNLKRLDNPSVTMHNISKYAGKSGGRSVPRKAIQLAQRGLIKELQKTKKKIVRK